MEQQLKQKVEEITKALVDSGKIIEAGWISLRLASISPNAPQVQVDEMRTAFFAGAKHLFSSLMTVLDPDEEITEDDMRRMDMINKELDDFINDFEMRNCQTEGSA